jgi:peptidoglycan/LPS O-acetylase OafA/YrhL
VNTEKTAVDGAGYIVELQSIRGIAAATVMLGHAVSMLFVVPLGLPTVLFAVANSHAAVVTFFVLSGFVLTRSLATKPQGVGKFYIRRIFRIYPALIVAAFAACASLWLIGVFPPTHAVPTFWQWNKPSDATAFHILTSGLGVGNAILPPLWSIFIELVGSIVIPLLFLLWRFKPILNFAVGAALCLISFTIGRSTHLAVGVYLVDFWIGALVALEGAAFFNGAMHRYLAPLALVVLVGFRYIAPWDYEAPFPAFVEAVASAALIGCIAYRPARKGFLVSTPMRTLGNMSYSLYLLHFSVIRVVIVLTAATFGLGAAWAFVAAIVSMALSLAVSYCSYIWIEVPGIRLGSKLLSLIGTKRRPDLAAGALR